MPNLCHLLHLLIIILMTSLLPPSMSDDPTSFVYAGCSQLRYNPGSPYQFNVDSILSSISTSSSLTSFSNFTSSNAFPSSPAYGLYQCRGDLSLSDCQSCIHSSLSQLSALCPSAAAASLQLQGCYLRYGNESFLGVPDNTLVFKKCGQTLSINGVYDPNMVSMRETALSQLQQGGGGGGGGYRTGVAGNFQAMSQCDGDLSPKECGDCVSAAMGQLRSSCSFAVSGDVYLGKCYAKYWSYGDYGRMSNSGGGGGGGGGGEDGSKNWAIVIGIVAGVILLIVFLSFIKRSASGKM